MGWREICVSFWCKGRFALLPERSSAKCLRATACMQWDGGSELTEGDNFPTLPSTRHEIVPIRSNEQVPSGPVSVRASKLSGIASFVYSAGPARPRLASELPIFILDAGVN